MTRRTCGQLCDNDAAHDSWWCDMHRALIEHIEELADGTPATQGWRMSEQRGRLSEHANSAALSQVTTQQQREMQAEERREIAREIVRGEGDAA